MAAPPSSSAPSADPAPAAPATPGATESGSNRKYLVLTAMIFAVSMTFIDMTIVSIAVPEIQRDLGLSSTGIQWVVNGYLLSLAALFAFGGRLAESPATAAWSCSAWSSSPWPRPSTA